MDTTISGQVFPRFCLFFLFPTLKTCAQKRAAILPKCTSPARAGQTSSYWSGPARCPFRPSGSARLLPARRGRGRSAFGCFRSQSRRAAEVLLLPARLQMSDPRADEGPGYWSPEARREPAGGVGDGPGVEGSQAAASGTQGRGTGGWAPPGLRAPHLGARLGRTLLCVPRRSGPAWASPARAEPLSSLLPVPRSPGPCPPQPPYPGPWSTLEVIFCFETPWFLLCFLSQISPDGSDRAALLPAPLQLLTPADRSLAADPNPSGLAVPSSASPPGSPLLSPAPAFPRASPPPPG